MAQNTDVHIEGSVPSPNTNGGISGNELQYDSLCTEQNTLSEVPNDSQDNVDRYCQERSKDESCRRKCRDRSDNWQYATKKKLET